MSVYRPYPAYKPSGVDWLGDVPEHWGVRRLKHTVQLRNEKVEATGGEYNYIGLENIESWTGRLLVSDSPIQPEGLSDSFESGNVLFGKLRPYLAKVYQARSSGTCTSELLVMRPVAVTPRFLYYALLSDQFIRLVDASTYGAKMPRASWNFIGTLPSVVPPFGEQQEISDFLDHETARLDAAIGRYERLIALLGEKRQALISHAVTKGLDPDAPMKDSGVKWLGEIPVHWEVTQVRRLARDGDKSFTDGDWIETPYITDEGFRLIQTGNIGVGAYKEQGFRFISAETFEMLGCTPVEPNDVLICRLADPVGRACLAPSLTPRQITSVDVCILKTRADVDERFVVYFLSSKGYLSYLEVSKSRGYQG